MIHPSISSRTQAAELLHSYILTYAYNRLGREAPDRSRLLALDALEVLSEDRREVR